MSTKTATKAATAATKKAAAAKTTGETKAKYRSTASACPPIRAPTSVAAASVTGAAVTETQGLRTDPGAAG